MTERSMDEITYSEAIGQLIAKNISKESQLLIRPLSMLFRRLYGCPRPIELIELCEEFLEGVRLYNQDVNSRFSQIRNQAKLYSNAADTILKQEPPRTRAKDV